MKIKSKIGAMGSVSADLIENSPVTPVWRVDGDVRSTRVMVAVDGSESALRAVDHMAFMLSGNPEVRFCFFHVTPLIKEYCEIHFDAEQDGVWRRSSPKGISAVWMIFSMRRPIASAINSPMRLCGWFPELRMRPEILGPVKTIVHREGAEVAKINLSAAVRQGRQVPAGRSVFFEPLPLTAVQNEAILCVLCALSVAGGEKK